MKQLHFKELPILPDEYFIEANVESPSKYLVSNFGNLYKITPKGFFKPIVSICSRHGHSLIGINCKLGYGSTTNNLLLNMNIKLKQLKLVISIQVKSNIMIMMKKKKLLVMKFPECSIFTPIID